MQRLALIGGGYSAVALVMALAELPATQNLPLRIDVYEPRAVLGQGLAYTPWELGDWGPLLNVPAGRMGPSLQRLEGFAEWWTDRGGRSSDFATRAAYGRYLAETLHQVLAGARHIQLVHHREAVSALQPSGRSWQMETSQGTRQAEQVVLAYGHEPRGLPPGDWLAEGWLPDPWSAGEAIDRLPPRAPVLLIGSSLTAVDVWLRLSLRPGAREGEPVHMLSRHGWLPQGHRHHDSPPATGWLPDDVLIKSRDAAGLMHDLRQLIADHETLGVDWRDVLGDLRSHTPRIWQQLPSDEQRQLARHAMSAWDSHRHRAAPPIARQLDAAVRTGRLRTHAGRLHGAQLSRDGLWQIALRMRGGGIAQLQAAMIINCTGPSPQACASALRLRSQGLAAGWYRPHPNGLGPEIDLQGRLLGADYRPQRGLWLLGPALRATHWEATAVPELRHHAARLAESLLASESRG